MKLVLVAAALSAVSYAQIDMAKITDCSALFDECRSGPDSNQATCAAAKAQCEQCQTDYSQCRAPGNGVSNILWRKPTRTREGRSILTFHLHHTGLRKPGRLRSPGSCLRRVRLPPAERRLEHLGLGRLGRLPDHLQVVRRRRQERGALRL